MIGNVALATPAFAGRSPYANTTTTTPPTSDEKTKPADEGAHSDAKSAASNARLNIEFDDESDRFVQTLIDPASALVLRTFPDETQLAFSRGVNAYMQALQAYQTK